MTNAIDALYGHFLDALKDATKELQGMELAGPEPEDMVDWVNPYNRISDLVNHMKEKVEERKNHTHEWNDDGFCSICGWNGNV